MKKILILALISIFVLSVFVACGSGNKDDMKDDITTMMDDMSSAMSEMDEALTQGGNITSDNNGTTGENLLEEIMPEDATTDIIDENEADISGEAATDGAVTTE